MDKIDNKLKSLEGERFAHTGFGRSLKGEQEWPPKTVNVRKWERITIEGQDSNPIIETPAQ